MSTAATFFLMGTLVLLALVVGWFIGYGIRWGIRWVYRKMFCDPDDDYEL